MTIEQRYNAWYRKRWLEQNRDRWNEYHREYMRKWRAKAEQKKMDQMSEGQKKLYRLARGVKV